MNPSSVQHDAGIKVIEFHQKKNNGVKDKRKNISLLIANNFIESLPKLQSLSAKDEKNKYE